MLTFAENQTIVKLPPEEKAQLCEALRSGRYPQGQNYLRSDTGFCCLGVKCALDGAEWLDHTTCGDFGGGKRTKNGAIHYPFPSDVTPTFHAVISQEPLFRDNQRRSIGNYLAGENDAGASFPEIADWIERNL